MDSGSIGWIIIVAIVIGLPVYLEHRKNMAKIMNASRPNNELEKRIAKLESRCEKLEEQVNAAHTLLATEQRELDQKLAALLPDTVDSPRRERADGHKQQTR